MLLRLHALCLCGFFERSPGFSVPRSQRRDVFLREKRLHADDILVVDDASSAASVVHIDAVLPRITTTPLLAATLFE